MSQQGLNDKIGETKTGSDKDFAGSGVEGAKAAAEKKPAKSATTKAAAEKKPEPDTQSKTIVTGEDALELLRKSGKKM